MTIERLLTASQNQLFKLLRRRVWLQEKLQPSEWQATLLWAALAGFVGALSALVFSGLTEGAHELLTGCKAGVVESMRLLPKWAVVLVPSLGGPLAGPSCISASALPPGKAPPTIWRLS